MNVLIVPSLKAALTGFLEVDVVDDIQSGCV